MFLLKHLRLDWERPRRAFSLSLWFLHKREVVAGEPGPRLRAPAGPRGQAAAGLRRASWGSAPRRAGPQGGFEYKRAIVDCIISIIEENAESKETGLSHLCEFIEDCEFTVLATRILHLLGQEGPRTSNPSKYIRFIYNRVVLEHAEVRAGALGRGLRRGGAPGSRRPEDGPGAGHRAPGGLGAWAPGLPAAGGRPRGVGTRAPGGPGAWASLGERSPQQFFCFTVCSRFPFSFFHLSPFFLHGV